MTEPDPLARVPILGGMGLIASYFAADRHLGEDRLIGDKDLSALGAIEGPAMLPTDLGDLERRMVGRESWTIINQTAETWLIRLGDEFVGKLASLSEPIDDERADDWQLSIHELDVLEILQRMATAARSRHDQALYVFLSL